MRALRFPTHFRIAGVALAAVAAMATTVLLPSMASAQLIGSGGQPGNPPAPRIGQPGDACALIYPPPAECTGNQAPGQPGSDICVQVYPPPPGCTATPPAPQPAYPSYPRWPSDSRPGYAPGQPPSVGQAPARVVLNRQGYQRGDQVMIGLDGVSRGQYPNNGGHRCDVVELQRWTPGGWVSAPSPGLDCVSAADVFAAGTSHTWAVPLNQQDGTYRVAIRVNDGHGQQFVYSDSFAIQ